MKTDLELLTEFFLSLMNSEEESSLKDTLWEIEFNEGGSIRREGDELILSGDNGICNLTETL